MLSWSGDFTGGSTTAVLTLDVPRSASLQLDPIPAITARGVWSAASDAPGPNVASGSLISIYGIHLASDFLVGPSNPLKQALGNVTVRVDGSFLPLLFVSSGQINAQLVSGLDPGPHTLIVRVEGKPEISVQINVARNAPGLFDTAGKDLHVGLFVRASGEVVTADNPARAGETLTVLGTGLGPYRVRAADGFLIGESTAYSLMDPINLLADDAPLAVTYAGAANAGVGIDAVRFQVPDSHPASGFIQVRVTVNGTDSNTVSLPVSPAAAIQAGAIEFPAGSPQDQ
jgi:uncharacterized protein (TIGR03437 family)